ncbi:hypothetical protein SK854_02050 [Lentzea sp. BCCO 10_0061]|uniref:NACHT domain-containing protein n=1 Tax=Lentzea sokolovensis TaxID=3095429 RepID=A0ABU4UN38_9PSEU|nr:hypothetical protein [Lentzea sp. BCCO 10_0061]MDX8140877.1 hypothetical protein [Lentzea sp. BCCO 10_0061]
MTDRGPSPRRIDVSGTGAAHAAGGLANTGVLIGNVTIGSRPSVRSRYLVQVRRIFSGELAGRVPELQALRDFCTADSVPSPYRWLRAPAWSGKSALLAWFVLHPLDNVRIVSFFITARLADQNDRNAFITVVMEQLLEFLDEPMPPFLTAANLEVHLLGLLHDAAAACRERGERLVLVVDGLDEDRGVHTGSDSHSIAKLLPPAPEYGMRVIVSGRPNPPIPVDVPNDHPLRDPSTVVELAPSPHAEALREGMVNDLKELLRGGGIAHDLLGLVTAAGGGLTAADLVALTGAKLSEVEGCLETVSGRSFAARPGHFTPDAADVFLLAHEELQRSAEDRLRNDKELDGYRGDLHSWADRWRRERWPEDTPEYLLRGYYNMLSASGDVRRMVAMATDAARQDRLLAVSGGDALALAEITTVQHALAEADDPDLVSLARLAVHRDHLIECNATTSAELPAVLTLLGQHGRAEAVIASIADPFRRCNAVLAVSQALAASGDSLGAHGTRARAESLAVRQLEQVRQYVAIRAIADVHVKLGDMAAAVALVRQITDAYYRDIALGLLVPTMTAELDTALEVARSISRSSTRGKALRALVTHRVSAREVEAAAELAQEIDDIEQRSLAMIEVTAGRATTDVSELHPQQQVAVLVCEARCLGRSGNRAQALAKAEVAAGVARFISLPNIRDIAVESVVSVLAALGELDSAENLARGIGNPGQRGMALRSVMTSAVGDRRRALAVANSIDEPFQQMRGLSSLAETLVRSGDTAAADQLVSRAVDLTGAISDPVARTNALGVLAGVMVRIGDTGAACELIADAAAVARGVADPVRQGELLWLLVLRLAKLDHRAAEALATSTPHTGHRVAATTFLAHEAARSGDLARAARLAATAQAVSRALAEPTRLGEALACLASAAARQGHVDQAARIIDHITEPACAVRPLVVLGEVVGVQDRDKGLGIVERAAAVLEGVADDELRLVVNAFVKLGESDRGAEVGASMPYSRPRHHVLWRAVEAVASQGRLAAARDMLRRFGGDSSSGEAFAMLARLAQQHGEEAFVDELVEEAEAVARTVSDPHLRDTAMWNVATRMAEVGRFDRAEALARAVQADSARNAVLAAVAARHSNRGNLGRAVEILRSLPAGRLVDFELRSTCWRLWRKNRADAVQVAESIVDCRQRALTFVDLANRASEQSLSEAVELIERAVEVSRSIADAGGRAEALVKAAAQMKAVGQVARAVETADDAVTIARGEPDESKRSWALVRVAEVLAEELDEVALAVDVAGSCCSLRRQGRTLTRIGAHLQWRGRFETAEEVVQAITDHGHRADGFLELARSGRANPRKEALLDLAETAAAEIDEPARRGGVLRAIAAAVQDPGRARRLVARALLLDRWRLSADLLAEIEPDLLGTIVAELRIVTNRPT